MENWVSKRAARPKSVTNGDAGVKVANLQVAVGRNLGA